MIDPLAEVVALLQPNAPFSKVVSGSGAWRVQRSGTGQAFYCVILEGASRLTADGHAPIDLQAGDFVLAPAIHELTMTSAVESKAGDVDPLTVTMLPGETRHGNPDGPPDVRLLVGQFVFRSPDRGLLLSLLPRLIHVREQARFATIVGLVADEARADRPAREMILSHLLDVLLLEAIRSTTATSAEHGLMHGLADDRLAVALRRMHEDATRGWTVGELAREASLSRSAFFNRFRGALGMAPMEYLLAWRMAKAKSLLMTGGIAIKDVAERVGYASASAFSVAFTRHAGVPPARYAKDGAQADARAPE